MEIAPVEVTISRLDLTFFELPEAGISVECSAGTYLRSLAYDLGKLAGCGAHLARLVRTKSGDFSIEQAKTVEELEILAAAGRLDDEVIAASRLLPEFPTENVDAITAAQIREGRDFRVSPFRSRSGVQYVKAVGPEGTLLAIGEAKLPNVYHPILVFDLAVRHSLCRCLS